MRKLLLLITAGLMLASCDKTSSSTPGAQNNNTDASI